MKCYCYETETEFIFCVEDAEKKIEDNLLAAWWNKTGDKFMGGIHNYHSGKNSTELIESNLTWLSINIKIWIRNAASKISVLFVGNGSPMNVGASDEDDKISIVNKSCDPGSLTMTTYLWNNAPFQGGHRKYIENLQGG